MNQIDDNLDTQPHANYRTIPLTKNQVALVDKDDYDEMIKYSWHASWDKTTRSFYALRADCRDGKCRTVSMHRQILGEPIGEFVDHANCDTLDNRKKNLRKANHSQSARNNRKRMDNKSGYKGVCMLPNGKYRASISVNKKWLHLGVFQSKLDASEAYRKAAMNLHGEFARFD